MATPTKAALIERLAALNVTAPDDASSDDLVRLLRRVRALRNGKTVQPPAARKPPAAPAPRPAFAAAPLASSTLTQARLPGPGSDHHRRPHDPMAGW